MDGRQPGGRAGFMQDVRLQLCHKADWLSSRGKWWGNNHNNDTGIQSDDRLKPFWFYFGQIKEAQQR